MPTNEGYEKLLLKLDRLKGKSGKAIHGRVEIACLVYDDDDFRANLGLDAITAAEFLDRRFADIDVMGDCHGIFNTLRHMLIYFPDVTDWSDGDLSGLRKKCDELRKQNESEDREERPRRRSATVKQLEEAEQRAREAEAEVRFLKDKIAKLERANASLERQIKKLEQAEELVTA